MWDALFHEGPKILFRVALSLLKIYEENMLRVKDAGGWAPAPLLNGCVRLADCSGEELAVLHIPLTTHPP